MGTTTRLLTVLALLGAPAVSHGQENRDPAWQERYDAQAVVFHAERGREIAYRGDSPEPLVGALFYDAVGREDLASVYRVRERTKSGSLAVAILAAYASFPMIYDGFDLRIQSPALQDKAIAAGGVALDLGAVILATRAFLIHREPVDSAARHRLADDYNGRLKEELEKGAAEREPAAGERGARFSWGFLPRERGGEVLLGTRF